MHYLLVGTELIEQVVFWVVVRRSLHDHESAIFPLSQPLIEPAAPFGGGSGVRKSFGRRAATSTPTPTKRTPEIIQLTSWISSDKLAKLGFLLYPLTIPWMENMHFGTDKSTKLRTQMLKGAHIAPTQMVTLRLITRIKERNATSQVCGL